MSTVPVTPVATPAPVATAPKKSAIQIIEARIVEFVKQREQAIANVHAIDGAIQGAQNILNDLRAEAVKAEAEGKKLVGEAVGEVEKVFKEVESKL